jgi:hypothetical protein
MKLRKHAYEIQGVQMLEEEDYHVRLNFCQQMRSNIINSHAFLEELTLSNEATSHISGKVNHHSCHIWGKGETLRSLATSKRLPKIKCLMHPLKSCIISHFFFNEATVKGESYHAMLQAFLIPEL